MKRGVKISIICGVIALILVITAIVIYFIFFKQNTYKIVGVEKTDYEVADFVEQSELKFFDNKTFHVHIERKGNGLALTGIEYLTDASSYQLANYTHVTSQTSLLT